MKSSRDARQKLNVSTGVNQHLDLKATITYIKERDSPPTPPPPQRVHCHVRLLPTGGQIRLNESNHQGWQNKPPKFSPAAQPPSRPHAGTADSDGWSNYSPGDSGSASTSDNLSNLKLSREPAPGHFRRPKTDSE